MMSSIRVRVPARYHGTNPWPAVGAMLAGFFMLMVDATAVPVASPAIMTGLHTDITSVVWVSSAYLLGFAVPLLVTGRLGDRFGPRGVYLAGLAVFTVASPWCGLTATIGQLGTARAVQGVGAALMAPQAMAVLTRTFPAPRRGRAMSLWSMVAGVGTLVGPVVGGLLVTAAGWRWIFFVNVPFGIVAFGLAWLLLPSLPTATRHVDVLGVVLSAVGMCLLVFGVQEGQAYGWGTVAGPMIGAGCVVLLGFGVWQARQRTEPLVSPALFGDRDFCLANVAVATIGFAVTALTFPVMFYAQGPLGLSPLKAALLWVPMAVVSAALAPWVGRLTGHVPARRLAGWGLGCFVIALVWLVFVMGPAAPAWHLLPPIALLGVANGLVWAPVGATATRHLPAASAGAGAGVYNTTLQVGSVLGSAGIAVLMQSLLGAHLGFAAAMAWSLWLPAAVLVTGLIAVLNFRTPDSRST